MHNYITRLLKTFDWQSTTDFLLSLAPSFKYRVNIGLMIFSSVWAGLDHVFGLDNTTVLALLVAFFTELISGITASFIRKEPLSSMKLSRFGLKVACYLVLIGVSYSLKLSFAHHDNIVVSALFGWMHVFFIIHVAFENAISILENLSVISGQDKTAWILQIKDKLKSFIG